LNKIIVDHYACKKLKFYIEVPRGNGNGRVFSKVISHTKTTVNCPYRT